MKRKWKALASLCLALALMLCLSLPVWAEPLTESSTGSITLSWEGDTSENTDYNAITVEVYKVIDVDYKYAASGDDYEAPKNPEFYWNEDVQSWVAEYDTHNKKDYIGEDNSVTQNFINLDSDDDEAPASADEIKSFADKMAAAIRAEGQGSISIEPVESVTSASGTNSVTLRGLKMGAYLVLIEGGVKIYSPAFVYIVPEWKNGSWDLSTLNKNVTAKSAMPTITKTVYDKNDLATTDYADDESKYAQVKIGDTITYMLVADVPQFPASATATGFQISDDLPEGIELDDDSVAVYGITEDLSDLGIQLTNNTHYILTTSNATRPDQNSSAVSFKITFDNTYDKIKTYSKIRVVYQATINKDIKIVDTSTGANPQISENPNTNTAYLDYNNNPYETSDFTWKTDSDTANVYTYGIIVYKKSGEADEPSTLLSGAEFTLKPAGEDDAYDASAADIKFVKDSNGVYYRNANQDDASNTTLAVDTNGKLTIKGLDVGTYYLTETKAPAGYTVLSNPITIVIEDDGITGIEENQTPNGTTEYEKTVEENTVEQENDYGYVSLEVLNHHGFSLPTTGGMGTVLFTAAGIALMGVGLAALVLYLRRRSDK